MILVEKLPPFRPGRHADRHISVRKTTHPGRSRAGNSVETIENQPSPTSTTYAESRGNRAPTDTHKPVSYN